MTTEIPASRRAGERPAFSFDQLRDLGVLWLVNRVVFNPRGFALCLDYADGIDEPLGWSIHGNGTEAVRFTGDVEEDEGFQRVEDMLNAARAFGRIPARVEVDADE